MEECVGNKRGAGRRPLKVRIARFLENVLGDEWGGGPCPPGATQELDFGELDEGRPMYVARTHCNDGHELWIGSWDKWYFHCKAGDARRLAWFVLWTWWAKGTWFGLKRKIWYRALSIIVASYKLG